VVPTGRRPRIRSEYEPNSPHQSASSGVSGEFSVIGRGTAGSARGECRNFSSGPTCCIKIPRTACRGVYATCCLTHPKYRGNLILLTIEGKCFARSFNPNLYRRNRPCSPAQEYRAADRLPRGSRRPTSVQTWFNPRSRSLGDEFATPGYCA